MQGSHRLRQENQREENSVSHIVWDVLLDEPMRRRVQEAALLVAQRMRDPGAVQRLASRARDPHSSSRFWDLSMPWAPSELALFYQYIARCFPKQDWGKTAHQYLKLVAINSQQHHLASPSLFGGISGVAFVIQQFSQTGQHYQQTLAHLHQSLFEQVHKRSKWQSCSSRGVRESDFDTMLGASGIVGYLASIQTPSTVVSGTLEILLEYLLALTRPGQVLGQERWFCPPALVAKTDRDLHPFGRFNCGLAHGIAGPLAALSLTSLRGYEYPGLKEAIAFVSTWLVDHQIQDAWGITWPIAIPYELAFSPQQWSTLPGSRDAWCYGIPGIARSLWLAGLALGEISLRQLALEALKRVFSHPRERRNIDAPILCHGTAGLLLICLHFAQESRDPQLVKSIPQLVDQILTQCDQESPLVFRDLERGGRRVTPTSLLTGVSGTALALLAAGSNIAPSWDRLLLLS